MHQGDRGGKEIPTLGLHFSLFRCHLPQDVPGFGISLLSAPQRCEGVGVPTEQCSYMVFAGIAECGIDEFFFLPRLVQFPEMAF
jgi:hypothetical protein